MILDKPWKVDRDGERIYAYVPGEVCIDVQSGTKEDRTRVMALLAQVQTAFSLIKEMKRDDTGGCYCAHICDAPCQFCRMVAVLRDAGMSDAPLSSEGT